MKERREELADDDGISVQESDDKEQGRGEHRRYEALDRTQKKHHPIAPHFQDSKQAIRVPSFRRKKSETGFSKAIFYALPS